MQKFFLFLGLLLIVFAGSFVLARKGQQKEEPIAFSNVAFAPASFSLKNRPMTLIIIGHNNGAFVEKTLNSVFSQSYDNFRLVYIDDASDDGSYDLARDLINASDSLTYVTVVQNETQLGLLANIYRAVSACPDEEIIVLLGAEDWLSHEWVLQRLNAYYEDPNLWIAMAQSIDYPSYCFPEEPELLISRHQKRGGAHLKSFYASLFKKIREKDFIHSGDFLKAASDLALMMPMLEMAKEHYHFIPEVLYVNNREVSKEEDVALLQTCERYIRSLDPYPSLSTLRGASCSD